jgi:hypothetical protein
MNKALVGLLMFFLFFSCNNYKSEHNGYFLAEEPEYGHRLAVERHDTLFYRYVGSNNEKRILQKGLILNYHLPDGTINKQYSWGEGSVVGGCIVRYGVDDSFFIVEQKPLDDVFGQLKNISNTLTRNREPSTVFEMEKMLNQCDCSKFWIVNIKTDDIYGPFNFEEFNHNKNKLGVSDKLNFKEKL